MSLSAGNTPTVKLKSANDIMVSGQILADGADNLDAGVIDILAGRRLAVLAGGDISADGNGQNSDGGRVIVLAEDRSTE